MKKKGFTLAELLGVIVILALITMITVPTITDSLQKYKQKMCITQLKEIEAAANAWGADNLFQLPDKGQTKTVSLKTLVEYGYIDGDIQNPTTKETFDLESTIITITKPGKKYIYTIDDDTKALCSE